MLQQDNVLMVVSDRHRALEESYYVCRCTKLLSGGQRRQDFPKVVEREQ